MSGSSYLKISRNCLLFLLVLLPFLVDQLNGFLLQVIGLQASLSQIVKLIYLGFFVFYLASTSRLKLAAIAALGLLLFAPLANNAGHATYGSVYADVVFFSKLLTLPLALLFFIQFNRNNPDYVARYYSTLYLTLFILFAAAILLSVFGFGFSQYGLTSEGVSMGYRGYFISGNEISALFILLYSLFLFHVFYFNRSFWVVFLASFLGLATAALIITKTALVSFLLITLGTPLFIHVYRRKPFYVISVYQKTLAMVILVTILLISGILFSLFKTQIQTNLERLSFNINRAGKIYTFLVSSRNTRFKDSFNLYIDKYNVSEKLFGMGWRYPIDYIQAKWMGWGSTETDWLDILLSNGIVGVVMIYGFWLYVLVKIWLNFLSRRSSYAVPLLISFTLLLANSFFAGHIIYASLVSLYMGFFISVLDISPPEYLRIHPEYKEVFCHERG
jgi:hypothetical protein